jgi:hypothetical protein
MPSLVDRQTIFKFFFRGIRKKHCKIDTQPVRSV